MSRRVNRDLRAAVSDYSLQASYAWWWMAIISEMFLTWCVEHPIVPPLGGAYCWQDNKNYDWRAARKRNRTLLRSMIKLETHDKPALQQSKWPLLNDFWTSVGQRHAPPPERRARDTPLLDNVTDKYRGNYLSPLSCDYFNRQEQTYRRLTPH